MSTIKRNVMANFGGSIWQALMVLAFVPLYIKFMGVESYGLIGIFTAFQALFVVLDMGLGATLSREMARLSVLPGKEQEMRNLVRSLEVIYWAVAVFIGLLIVVLAPFIANYWVKGGQLSPQTIEQAVRIMGFAMALQWPASFYSGGLLGLQKQVLLSAINSGIGTLRGVGAVLVLWQLSPTIEAFFLWQIVVSFVGTFLLSLSLWYTLPRAGGNAVFKKHLLAGVWRFAAGMAGISVLATILIQLDKIILSKMLPLEVFGYYTLAGTVGMSLYCFIRPIFSAVYPRVTQLVSLSDLDGLKRLYHKSSQFMSVIIIPVAVVVALFSYEVLLIWTQNPVTAEKCHLLVTILICGTALNGLMHIPYALQLAHGWVKFGFYTNLISVIILTPMIVFLTSKYGAIGGASAWVILNSGYVVVAIYFMHRRLLPDEKWRWYWQDVGLPLLTSLVVAGLARFLVSGQISQVDMVFWLTIISLSTLSLTAVATPVTRNWLFEKLSYFRRVAYPQTI